MQKEMAESIKSATPGLITSLGNYLKNLFSKEHQKELLINSTSSINFLINVFGKPVIDSYFKKHIEKKLENKGFYTYILAAFKQAQSSLQKIKGEENEKQIDLSAVIDGLQVNLGQRIDRLDNVSIQSIFQPKYHPAVYVIKLIVSGVLSDLDIAESNIKIFNHDFNMGIEKAVEDEFGTDYEEHKRRVEKFWFQEQEAKLLLTTIGNGRIGFTEFEDLKYEDTYGTWRPYHTFDSEVNDNTSQEQIDKYENSLYKVDDMITQYFDYEPESHLDKILFIVADFGKGKSVFLRHYAANLAQNYIDSAEGYIPIYFNLRNFSAYQKHTEFGIIDDFLQSEFAINISTDYFRTKKYIFLIDSLDESCDLSKLAVDDVISSIKRIQSLDKTKIRENKLIVSSRPFGAQLNELISSNKPFLNKIDGKNVGHFISVYGFKKNQFNDWIFTALSAAKDKIQNPEDGILNSILEKINRGEQFDIYSEFSRNKTLAYSELRRPIFAYMIYQLIINNINVTKTGKIGIYLSFLNLLSKDAKYVHDPSWKTSIREQFEARNILHAIAALWCYQRKDSKQAFLKKADICRYLEGKNQTESDESVLARFTGTGVNEIQFLSHSYFGENDNILHFQHQSFAEILLAEYYIKVLLKFALDRSLDIEQARSRLKIGLPTPQTVEFFTEILQLIKETAVGSNDPDIFEKRKLLVPLLSSICITKHNSNLHSERLFYEWYNKATITPHTTEIPEKLITEWFFDSQSLDEILNFCENVINHEQLIVISKSRTLTNLFNNELTVLTNSEIESTQNVEKMLLLIVGNKFCIDEGSFFIRRFSSEVSLYLLKTSQYFIWANQEFKGVTIKGNGKSIISTIISNLNLHAYELSSSVFEHVYFSNINFFNTKFDNSSFSAIVFECCTFMGTTWKDVIFGTGIDFTSSIFGMGYYLPVQLVTKTLRGYQNKFNIHHLRMNFTMRFDFEDERSLKFYIASIQFFLRFGLSNNLFNREDIASVFIVKTTKMKTILNEVIKSVEDNIPVQSESDRFLSDFMSNF